MNNNSISQLRAAWSLVIQRVSEHTAEIWVGSLRKGVSIPIEAQLVLKHQGKLIETQSIRPVDWLKPFSGVAQGFYSVRTFNALLARQHYQLELHIRPQAKDDELLIATGEFDCLPAELPSLGERPFTIALGSCYSNQGDDGQVSAAYQALYRQSDLRPDVTFLVGDQVYLDIGFDSLNPIPSMIRERIANDYARHWHGLAGVFRSGATWMLPDDHEYWNDYPFNDQPILALKALNIGFVKRAWLTAAREGVAHIQRPRLLEVVTIGSELSICLADLRSERNSEGFLPEEAMSELVDWAKHLSCPGVLVLPQILIDQFTKGERNLLNFRKQYITLLEALADTGQDIVVLSGDVHFGRIAQVRLGNKGGRLIEVVASPLSNLQGYLNGFATAIAQPIPEYFPDPKAIAIPGWQSAKVHYDPAFQVSGLPGKRFSRQPMARTREHFMTLGFSKNDLGQVELRVQAWGVRAGQSGQPESLFAEPFCVTLGGCQGLSQGDEQRKQELLGEEVVEFL